MLHHDLKKKYSRRNKSNAIDLLSYMLEEQAENDEFLVEFEDIIREFLQVSNVHNISFEMHLCPW